MERLTVQQARITDGVLEINQAGEFKPADDVLQLSQGEADSTGLVVIGEAIAFYIVNTQPDLQSIIDQLIDVCSQVEALSLQQVSRTPDQTPLDPLVTTEIQRIKQELTEFELK